MQEKETVFVRLKGIYSVCHCYICHHYWTASCSFPVVSDDSRGHLKQVSRPAPSLEERMSKKLKPRDEDERALSDERSSNGH